MNRDQLPRYTAGIKALQDKDFPKFKRILADPELSLAERTLLRAREVTKAHGPEAGEKLLKAFRPQNEFFSGEKSLLLAHVRFLEADFESAIIRNMAALEAFSACQDRRGVFLSLYNLSVDYNQLGVFRVSQYYLERAEKCMTGAAETSLVWRAWACQHSTEEKHEEACVALAKALDLKGHLGAYDQAGLLTVAADIYFRAGRYDECIAALESILNGQHFGALQGRARFELQIARLLSSGRNLPARKGVVTLSTEYALKWDILKAIQGGEIKKAETLWKKLQGMSPQIFGPDFIILGDSERRSIFGSFLGTLIKGKPKDTPSSPLKGRLGKLESLLSGASTPLRKEDLIEQIWGIPYDSSLDDRFYKLIERLKKTSSRTILTANRTYFFSPLPDRKVG